MTAIASPTEHEQRLLANSRNASKIADMISARMRAEEAVDLSDAEIYRTLSPCVGGSRLMRVAIALRELDLLKAGKVCAE